MNSNGRRRWRKWLASERKRGDGWGADIGRCRERVAYARRHRGQSDVPEKLAPLPAKPFDPRSLVGMSQAARKRWARRDAVTANPDGRAVRTHKPELARHMLGVFEATSTLERVRTKYLEARARYRIGERLRPCPNCMKCWPWTETLEGDLVAALAPPKGAPRRFQRLELDDICDGSGTLKASPR